MVQMIIWKAWQVHHWEGPLKKDSTDFVCTFSSLFCPFLPNILMLKSFSNCQGSIQFCASLMALFFYVKEEVFNPTSQLHVLNCSAQKHKQE